MKDKLFVIKIGGNIIDDEANLSLFLKDFASVEGKKILVHGGGKLATRMAEALHIPQQMIEGRRVTDSETLKIVTMVYAGAINKNIVAQLQANHCNAIGLTGADGNAIAAHKRVNASQDYGFAGDIDTINTDLLMALLQHCEALIMAPITHNQKGQLLNTNADTIAQEMAQALSEYFETHLIYSFEKAGVLSKVEDEASVINQLDFTSYQELKIKGSIFAGMIPKLDNAFSALQKGVHRVVIGKGDELPQLISGACGTSIIHE